ncbi:hypothetical protein COY65_01690 [Candidatus Jorgensenbacteria bacterium CG_4_10_14_0_8_um_filter_39_13]|uniref:Uncharacterized protein n=2 Tax=Candidatus Joergenseniibacteriota TaxID=1752739 RepID=A0A2M7RGZ5_9BACT|nr:MAG: hypothetical protein COV54_00185 [Candidatus Jorgensenbacteria bacterium CG11_big_fil_rev_8_21_14_0_20_38_23]PIV13183.1 MAG: hypothetical protein COS46_01425 [Candidatus Jorgensenbacteria bacterium CG03_land_8_20_14_0_80_38_39]PIW97604.1 MAG: hypothetical protein COZ81_01800 [Candidatus Jorgensenbacteria bacterium CG_4_8_14_3_um_filter_38_10]PIY96020.1 MAG: hypothetical protein COY65_01690 [Candidatus Jorgensenbacteria bacterium CG_4_10_14_0_8_um_filter_39_13]PJA94828.1 MAG: hypothetica
MTANIKKFFKTHSKKQLLLILLNSLGGILTIAISIYLLIFLISNLNSALSGSHIKQPAPLQFDISGFEKLNLNK